MTAACTYHRGYPQRERERESERERERERENERERERERVEERVIFYNWKLYVPNCAKLCQSVQNYAKLCQTMYNVWIIPSFARNDTFGTVS